MKAKKPNIPRFSDLSKRANAVLARGETRLTLIEALVVMMVQMMLFVVLTQTAMTVDQSLGPVDSARYEQFDATVMLVWWIAVILVAVFLSLPLWVGFLRMAARAADGEEIVLAMLFEPLSSWRNYRLALRLGGMLLWACLFSRRFHVVAVALRKDVSLREAKRMTKKWRGFACSNRFELHFALWWLLGFLTVGILLVWDTIPRMALVYFGYAEEMEKNMIQLEEDKHE